MVIESTSSASISGPKLGDLLSVSGIPSTTNCVWYSEPRGCSTALPSYNQPGCVFTRSCTDRPGSDVTLSSICFVPTCITDDGLYGSISVVSSASTLTCVTTPATASSTFSSAGNADLTTTTLTAGANPARVTFTWYTP